MAIIFDREKLGKYMPYTCLRGRVSYKNTALATVPLRQGDEREARRGWIYLNNQPLNQLNQFTNPLTKSLFPSTLYSPPLWRGKGEGLFFKL